MNETVLRLHYRCTLKENVTEAMIKEAIEADKVLSEKAHALISENRTGLLTEAVFVYKNMLFLYMETVDADIDPKDLWPKLSLLLKIWPSQKESEFAKMNLVFYFARPEGLDDFTRKTAPDERCGRIAFLKPDTMFDYVYSHTALVMEGALMGEKWQSIALHENILFSYLENPRLKEINVKRNPELESQVIEEWLNMDPASHFDRIDPSSDFLFIPCFYSIG